MSLFSDAVTFLQRRTPRSHAPGQPDSRRRRERALRAASSLDLERSKSDLELEQCNTGHEPASGMQKDTPDMKPCGTVQADKAVDSYQPPISVSLAPTLELDIQKGSATPNDSQPKHFFAVAQRVRAEAYIDGAEQEQAHLSVPLLVSKPAIDPGQSNGQLWEATPGRQHMAKDVVGSELKHLDTVIVEASNEDVAAEEAHADAIRGEASHEQTSQPVPLPASEITLNLGAPNGNEEDGTGHPGIAQDAAQPEANELEPAIVENRCQDLIVRKAHTEVSMSEAVSSHISLPASPGVPFLFLGAKPRVVRGWETTSGQQQTGLDDVNAVPAEPEAGIVLEKCTSMGVELANAEEFLGQGLPLQAFSTVVSPASEGTSNRKSFGGLETEPMSGHPKVMREDVQAEPTNPDPVIVEEHGEGLVLQKATAEVSTGEAVPIEASAAVRSCALEFHVQPEHLAWYEWEAASDQLQEVQDDVQAKPTESASMIAKELFEESVTEKAEVKTISGESTRKHTIRHMVSPASETPSDHEAFSCAEREAMQRQPRMAQETMQAELTSSEPAIVEEGCENTIVHKTHVEVSMGGDSPTSFKGMPGRDEPQQSISKLMQVAKAKRRLVGKQPIEEQQRKLQKQLGSHPPLRSVSTIVRSCLGHLLQPSEQGCTIRVLGDGWGGLGEDYLATVTEADASSFTVIRQGAHWEETHVLREYCHLIVQPELCLGRRHLGNSQPQAKRRRTLE